MYMMADIWIHVIRMQARSFIHVIHDISPNRRVLYADICNAAAITYRVTIPYINSRLSIWYSISFVYLAIKQILH